MVAQILLVQSGSTFKKRKKVKKEVLAYELTQLKFKNIVSLDSDWKLVSFDVSSFFTSVPLDFTMDVILRWIYRNKEIVAHITLNESKELILLFKSLFTKDGIAMGFSLRPDIAGIFMVELERGFLSVLSSYITS